MFNLSRFSFATSDGCKSGQLADHSNNEASVSPPLFSLRLSANATDGPGISNFALGLTRARPFVGAILENFATRFTHSSWTSGAGEADVPAHRSARALEGLRKTWFDCAFSPRKKSARPWIGRRSHGALLDALLFVRRKRLFFSAAYRSAPAHARFISASNRVRIHLGSFSSVFPPSGTERQRFCRALCTLKNL